jgi:hypothetical protein
MSEPMFNIPAYWSITVKNIVEIPRTTAKVESIDNLSFNTFK